MPGTCSKSIPRQGLRGRPNPGTHQVTSSLFPFCPKSLFARRLQTPSAYDASGSQKLCMNSIERRQSRCPTRNSFVHRNQRANVLTFKASIQPGLRDYQVPIINIYCPSLPSSVSILLFSSVSPGFPIIIYSPLLISINEANHLPAAGFSITL